MLSQDIKDKVITKVDYYCALASEMYNIPILVPVIQFKKLDSDAARAVPQKNLLEFNSDLLYNNIQDYINNTVPHEVAHLISYIRHGWVIRSGIIHFHGKEWREIMIDFGCSPLVYHDYK